MSTRRRREPTILTDSGSPRQKLAFLLWKLADLIQADQRRRSFRAKAYRRAIWSLDDLSPLLDDPNEHVLGVPGLGTGMVRLIEEYRSTGHLGELDDLLDSYPAEAGRLRQLPRMTPQILRGLKHEAGVETSRDLLASIETGGALLVKGVGEATAERWLDLLEGWPSEGVPAHQGWALAVLLRDHLRSRLGPRVEIGGEVRRVTEWVTRLDLLVQSADPQVVRQYVRSSVVGIAVGPATETHEVLSTPAGLDLHVEITPEAQWGTNLIRVTGPADHISSLEPLGAFGSESAAYASVGWGWVPPAARAPSPPPPDLVDVGMIKGDLHIHSAASPDGRMSLDSIAASLIARGYEYAVITDHTIGLRFGGLDGDAIRRQKLDVERVGSSVPGLTLLQGAEINLDRDGTPDIDEETLDSLDLVVAGVHSDFDLSIEDQTRRVIRGLSHPAVRVLAHPTGRRVGLRAPLRLDIGRVVEAAVRYGVALESNGHRDRLDVSSELAQLAGEEGAVFVANSDAHRIGEFVNIENAVATLQRAGIGKRLVVNTLPRGEFLDWLSR
jgi:DNA polymerase (family 10)